MFGKQEFYVLGLVAVDALQFFAQEPLEKHFFLDPDRNGRNKRPDALWGKRVVRFQQALEFQQRLVVENNRVEVVQAVAAVV